MEPCVAMRQRGIIMLFMLLVLALASSVMLSGSLSGNLSVGEVANVDYSVAINVMKQLQEAKTALLAYALAYADNYRASGAGPGHLPCPDTDPPDDGNMNNDGPDPPCGRSLVAGGRLPRLTRLPATELSPPKMLEFYPLRSLVDQQPWYFVSTNFINNPLDRKVNPQAGAPLEIGAMHGSSQSPVSGAPLVSQSDVIAVVVEPGRVLLQQHQHRPGNRMQDYLEFENADSDTRFRQDHRQDSNDRVLAIEKRELLPLLKRRVAGKVSQWLLNYHRRVCPQNRLPVVVWSQPGRRQLFRQSESDQVVRVHGGNFGGAQVYDQNRHSSAVDDYSSLLRTVSDTNAGCYPYASGADSFDCESGSNQGGVGLALGNCSNAVAINNVLEGTPLQRHWFVRNGWPDFASYRIDPLCREHDLYECQIHIDLHARENSILVTVGVLDEG